MTHENELFHEKAKLLSDLLKNELSFEWKEEQHKAFEDLKEKISSTVLKFLNFTKSFEIHIDTNVFIIGGVLRQEGPLITFETKKLYGAQLRWPIHEKELYVIISCLKMWQHFLGTHKTKVFTDNVSLKYFETQLKVSTKQLRWHNTLALLDVEMIHKLRWDNVVPNTLSRKEKIQVEKPPTKT